MKKRDARPTALALTLCGLGLLTLLAGSAHAQTAPPAGTVYSGPITISHGGTYTGNWQSLDPAQAAVTITTNEPVVIENANIQSRGDLILSKGAKANVTVRQTHGEALNPGLPASAQQHPGYFVHLEGFESADIENNDLVGTAGMYFYSYQPTDGPRKTIRVIGNRALNIDGRFSDGADAFSPTDFYRVQFVQFNDVKNVMGAEIGWNQVVNEPGKSRVEEVINMFGASGTVNSPILIHDNYVQGAYPLNPATDSFSGGGIMLGDGHGATLADASGYIRAYRNQVVGTSNLGIGIAAGHDISAYDNRVVSSGLLPDGTTIASQNVGLYVWDMQGDKSNNTFFNNSLHDNVVGWARPGDGADAANPYWFPDCDLCQANVIMPGPVTPGTEAAEYQLWLQKLAAAQRSVGAK